MFFNQKFRIFFTSGKIVEVDDLLSYIGNAYGAVEAFYMRMKFDGQYKKMSFWYESSEPRFEYAETFYLFTSKNVMIAPDLFRNEYKALKRKDNIYIWYNNRGYTATQWNHCHAFSGGYTETYYRKFKNTPNHRAVCAVQKEEGEPEFRGKRRNLPDPWDEKMSRRSLSWKECTKRKRQHKGS